jgi:hypothetical protein
MNNSEITILSNNRVYIIFIIGFDDSYIALVPNINICKDRIISIIGPFNSTVSNNIFILFITNLTILPNISIIMIALYFEFDIIARINTPIIYEPYPISCLLNLNYPSNRPLNCPFKPQIIL